MKGGKQQQQPGPTPPATAAAASSSLYGDVLSRYLPSSAGAAPPASSKRPSQALYHQTIFGAPNTLGQSEAWYSIDALAKRPRFETACTFPIYPQRPGEKDCAHYMLTRTCKFGDTCKFDHPLWVPEGGIPDWKEVPIVTTSEILPERPGQPDCPYFLKTQTCKFGFKCKFNHPKDKLNTEAPGIADISALPERPSEPLCAFYLKTGKCKFGGACKFHHPKDAQILLAGQGDGIEEQSVASAEGSIDTNMLRASSFSVPALSHNSKGLPLRPGEVDCPFYMKTGSCKYSASCRYNHPDWNEINPAAAALEHPVLPPLVTNFGIGVMDPAVSFYQPFDPALTYPAVAMGYTSYPQRPGQPECDYYMKTGECKFGERCRFHHPADRTEQSAVQATVKLTPGGLPRREDAVRCPYYMKTGTCKYAVSCKFDHPPPEEVIAEAASSSQGQQQVHD